MASHKERQKEGEERGEDLSSPDAGGSGLSPGTGYILKFTYFYFDDANQNGIWAGAHQDETKA